MRNIILKGLIDHLNYVHSFEDALIRKYGITDITRRRTGIRFPEIGAIEIEGVMHNYRFHGGGCYLDNGFQKLDFLMDASSKNKYYTVPGNFLSFIQSYMKESDVHDLSYNSMKLLLTELRDEGVLGKAEYADGVYVLIEDRIREEYKRLEMR